MNAIIFHGGYSTVELGLLQNTELTDTHSLHKHNASRDGIIALTALLSRNTLTLNDCTFIGVHQGPGPFTTLRVVLATANGLAFGSQLPLVGVDGLDAFIEETKTSLKTRFLAIMLNAFCDDIYYALYDSLTGTVIKGWASIDAFLAIIADTCKDSSITFTGNGVEIHQDKLKTLSCKAQYLAQEICSIQSVAHLALNEWHKGKIETQLMPLYLKTSLPPSLRT